MTELGPDHPEVLGRQVTLGSNYCDAGRFADGIALIESVRQKGSHDPHPAWVRTALLKAYVQAGKTAEAKALVTERIWDARVQFPFNSPELDVALADAGNWLLDAKAYSDAEPLLLDNYKWMKEENGGSTPQTIKARSALERLVRLYDGWGNLVEAAKWQKELQAARPADEWDGTGAPK